MKNPRDFEPTGRSVRSAGPSISPDDAGPETPLDIAAEPAPVAFRLTRPQRTFIYILYAFAAYAVVRIYTLGSTHYLVLADYMSGHERLPFQKRVLPMLLLEQLEKIPFPQALMRGRKSIFASHALIDMFALDLSAFLVAGFASIWLYRQVAPRGRFALLVFPIFVYATVWTYIMHTEQNYYYQYDMLSLAFFTLGLCFVYARRFLPLLAVMAVGTLNRETTLFLIPIFVLDALAPGPFGDWRRVPLVKTALLCAVWLAIKITLDHRYALNDRSEDYLRLWENLRRLAPQHWAEVLGGCGFLLPVIWWLRRQVPDPRIATWLFVIPFWVAVMFCYGVVVETRIYGELCALVSVATALLLDAYGVQQRRGTGAGELAVGASSG